MALSNRKFFTLFVAILLSTGLFLTGCGEAEHEADAVESGTYKGVLMEVKPEEEEIYVETDDDKTIELYFTEETTLVDSSGETMPFSELSTEDRVEVDVEKVGQRTDPVRVQLLEN